MKILAGERLGSSSSEDELDPNPESDDYYAPIVRVDSSNPSSTMRRVRNPMRRIRQGDYIDVREEFDGIWYPAQVMKLDLQQKKLFVSFSPQETTFDKWVPARSSRIAPLYTHTYDEQGNFKVDQMIEVVDDRGVWRGARITDIHQNMVKVQYVNCNNNDTLWIQDPVKRIRTFRRGFRNHPKKWKIPGPSANSLMRSGSGQGAGASAEAVISAGGTDDDNRIAPDNRTRQIEVFSDRYSHYVAALGQQGLAVAPMAGDGNCLFRSVAHQVYGNDALHWLVREKCMSYMEANSPFFSQFVEGGMDTFHLYLSAKRQNGCWGDDPEIQAMCELYGRRAEIWAYDPARGARRLRTFHEAVTGHGVVMPIIMLSYYGGGHYDSIVGPYSAANILREEPGRLEDLAILRSTATETSRVDSSSLEGATEGPAAGASVATEDAAVDLTIQLSRNGMMDWAQEDLDSCLSLAIEDKAKGHLKDPSDYSSADLHKLVDANPEIAQTASDIAASQQAVLKSVTEQSEREFIERAIMKSLTDDTNVTDEDILEMAKKASMQESDYGIPLSDSGATDEEILELAMKKSIEDSSVLRSQLPASEDNSLELALKLSMMSEEEALQYALKQSASSSASQDPFGRVDAYYDDDEDALLRAALCESMLPSQVSASTSGSFVPNPQELKWGHLDSTSSSALGMPSANGFAIGNEQVVPVDDGLTEEDEELRQALLLSMTPGTECKP